MYQQCILYVYFWRQLGLNFWWSFLLSVSGSMCSDPAPGRPLAGKKIKIPLQYSSPSSIFHNVLIPDIVFSFKQCSKDSFLCKQACWLMTIVTSSIQVFNVSFKLILERSWRKEVKHEDVKNKVSLKKFLQSLVDEKLVPLGLET